MPRKRSTGLTKSNGGAALVRMVENIAARAMADAEGLYLPAGATGYNPDAGLPLAEASTKTRFSMEVYRQVMATQRTNTQAAVQLGVVAMQARMSKEKWEAEAAKVETQAQQDAIDAEATPVEEEKF